MPRARFRFEVEGGVGAVSSDRPDTEFRIVAHLPTETGLLIILDIQSADNTAVNQILAEEESLQSGYEILHSDSMRTVLRYELPFVPPPHRAIFESGNFVPLPLSIRNGWAIANLTTSQERLSQLKDAFESAGVTYEVDSIKPSTDPTALLTDRQREFVLKAVEQGYYESPRQCTLTDLAAMLGVSKGAASGTLHRAERRIVRNFLGKPSI